jgi:hypothetical protein
MGRGSLELTDLGKIIAAKDGVARSAWTWWLIHLHLSANVESFPYRTFFNSYDAGGKTWLTVDDIVKALHDNINDDGNSCSIKSVESWFGGIEITFRQNQPFQSLGLVERRLVKGERTLRIRRVQTKPKDVVVVYAAMLFQKLFFKGQETVETRKLIDAGLANSIGLTPIELRNYFTRIHQSKGLGEFIQYRKAANLDSVQFSKREPDSLSKIRSYGYMAGDVRWP